MSEEIVAIPLLQPSAGTPEIIETEEAFSSALDRLAQGSGPFAVDAERASGFRYSARAYLIQIKRTDGGLHLIDPIPFGPGHQLFSELDNLLNTDEVILHASTQDLPCLRELGINPAKLFDTELAGRIAGLPRVGLGPLLESLMGVLLAKEHSAADWSTRPLPDSWLNYAALDVEFLIELWELLATQLQAAEKYTWAIQEFDHVKRTTVPIERVDPWRRTSGMHVIRKPRELAVVREVWYARDQIAQDADIAAGRILSDSHIVTLASSGLTKAEELKSLSFMHLRNVKRHAQSWIESTLRAHQIPETQLPPLKLPATGPPAPRNWEARNPQAWQRLEFARAALSELAENLGLPIENLITPEVVRKILWTPPESAGELLNALAQLHARPWQIELVAPILEQAIWHLPEKVSTSEQ